MDRETKYVRWQTFAWVVGVITLILGFIINTQINISSRLNDNQVEFAKLQTKLASIETTLLEIKTDIKTHLQQK